MPRPYVSGAGDRVIGIRREDKNRWERRVPLTPEHVAELTRRGLSVTIQPSALRVFPDENFQRAGARVADDLSSCPLVVGVKEIPAELLHPGTAYVFFAHVTKGQAANMPMLRRLIDLRCTLMDYEKIVDDRGHRLVFFGRHAGFAGMIDTLATLGRRLVWEGTDSPFATLRPAHAYADLEEAHAELANVADAIRRDGIPGPLHPMVFGFTGSGNVSKGAQEIFDHLPYEEVLPEDLPALFADEDVPRNLLYKVVFRRTDRVARADGGDLDGDALRRQPRQFHSVMGPHLAHLTVLVNGIYWEPGQPRVASRDDLRALFAAGTAPRLRVIGDISCDVDGSIEANVRITTPDDPVYVYDPVSEVAVSGVAGHGPVILAVDNLPCEIPVDSSQHFGDALLRFLPALARCDWSQPFDALDLPDEIRRAVIVHRGRITPAFAYLEQALV
jgi:alpha-aminoadipic semialdehyde synthase